MTNAMYPEVDQLEAFVQRVRNGGVWCDTSVKDHLAHKFVCKHPRATIAISLCGVIIKPFEKLHENVLSQRCLICELYDNAREEVQGKILSQLTDAIDKYENQSTDKEKGQ